MKLLSFLGCVIAGSFLASCASYKHNILFQVSAEQVQKQTTEAETNYVIQKHDLLSLKVYTNHGETLIDPNLESFKAGREQVSQNQTVLTYLVDVNGNVKLPLIDEFKAEGLSIREAEVQLQKAYGKYYQEPFVVLSFNNKRVVVLGAPVGQIVPLTNENMRLTEVLALSKGITPDARAKNIRVIRANKVFIADLSTFEGYQKHDMVMQPGDIVYIEPVRRPFIEGLRDYSPLITIVTSLATLIFIISQVQ